VNNAEANKTDGLSPALPPGVMIDSPSPKGENFESNGAVSIQRSAPQDDIVGTNHSSLIASGGGADLETSSLTASLFTSWDASRLPIFDLFSQIESMGPCFPSDENGQILKLNPNQSR